MELCMCWWFIVLSLFSVLIVVFFFFFKQKTAYEMRISDWSSDVCSSDLRGRPARPFSFYRWGRCTGWRRAGGTPALREGVPSPYPSSIRVFRVVAGGAVGLAGGVADGGAGFGGGVEVVRGVDERDVREGLGEVAELVAAVRVVLLGEQADVVADRQQVLEPGERVLAPADQRQRVAEPEAAREKRALARRQAVRDRVRAIAQHEAVHGQLARSEERRVGKECVWKGSHLMWPTY